MLLNLFNEMRAAKVPVSVRELLDLINALKHNVVFADNREAAIAQLRRHEPAVVTLDLGLPPDPDGATEGLQCLKDMVDVPLAEEVVRRWPGTSVAFMSGYSEGAVASSLLTKPFRKQDLARHVRNALDSATD